MIIEDKAKFDKRGDRFEGRVKRVNIHHTLNPGGHREDRPEDNYFYRGNRNVLDMWRTCWTAPKIFIRRIYETLTDV